MSSDSPKNMSVKYFAGCTDDTTMFSMAYTVLVMPCISARSYICRSLLLNLLCNRTAAATSMPA